MSAGVESGLTCFEYHRAERSTFEPFSLRYSCQLKHSHSTATKLKLTLSRTVNTLRNIQPVGYEWLPGFSNLNGMTEHGRWT